MMSLSAGVVPFMIAEGGYLYTCQKQLWTIEYEGYYSWARFTLLWGYPYKWWTGSRASGLVHTINSASGLRAIDKHLAG